MVVWLDLKRSSKKAEWSTRAILLDILELINRGSTQTNSMAAANRLRIRIIELFHWFKVYIFLRVMIQVAMFRSQ